MMYARGKMGFQQKGQVMSLPPDPPLSTSSSHLFLNFYCPKNRGNYTDSEMSNLQVTFCFFMCQRGVIV